MAKKENKYTGPKEYVWELEVDDELVTYKCVVLEDEVVTYQNDEECKHLKIMDKTRKVGLLQIDTQTRVFDEIVPFQLENGVPYIKLDGKWVSSDTYKEERLQQKIYLVKRDNYGYGLFGLALVVIYLVSVVVTGDWGEWPIMPVFGFACLGACGLNLVRLKNELEAMGRKFTFKLKE